MTDLHRLFPRPVPNQESLGESPGGGQNWADHHLEHVMLDAIRRFETGDVQGGLTSLSHAVFVAAFTGPQGLSQHEVSSWCVE